MLAAFLARLTNDLGPLIDNSFETRPIELCDQGLSAIESYPYANASRTKKVPLLPKREIGGTILPHNPLILFKLKGALVPGGGIEPPTRGFLIQALADFDEARQSW